VDPVDGAAGWARRVELPDGQTVVIRAGGPDDLDGIAALYAGLSDDDTYLRFFSAHRPGRELFERMVHVADHGGALLVVEVTDEGERTIVGDAWYSLLPNGDGELAITVAEQWRGWLGAYLLDALLAVAAENGIPNLEAEIMVGNRPMLSLVRRRGCVRMADDGSATRVAVATRGRVPSWPPEDHRPRVLVEGHTGWRAHDAAARRGLDVLVCPGPPASRAGCPALSGGSCPLIDDADAVIVSLATDDEATRALIRSHRERHPDQPLLVEAKAATPLDEGITRLVPGLADDEVVDLVLHALAGTKEGDHTP
jgi:hypothetical protein